VEGVGGGAQTPSRAKTLLARAPKQDCAVIGVGRPWLPVDRRQKGGARGCGGSWGDLEVGASAFVSGRRPCLGLPSSKHYIVFTARPALRDALLAPGVGGPRQSPAETRDARRRPRGCRPARRGAPPPRGTTLPGHGTGGPAGVAAARLDSCRRLGRAAVNRLGAVAIVASHPPPRLHPCPGHGQGHRVVSAPSLDHSALPPAGVGGSWGTVGGEWGPLPALHAPTQACCSGAGGHPAGRRQPESPPFSRRWPGVRWLTERGGDPRAPPERVVRGLGRRPQGVGDGYAPVGALERGGLATGGVG